MLNRLRFVTILLAVVLGSLAFPALVTFAQDTPPPVRTPEEARDYLLEAVRVVTTVAYVESLVLIVTQILKVGMTRFLPQNLWLSPAMLALAVQVVFWVGHVLSNQLGYGQQYRDVLAMVENILKAFQPLLPVTIITGLGAHATYNVLHKARQPGFQMQVSSLPKAA